MKKFLGTVAAHGMYLLGHVAYHIGYPEAYQSCIFWVYFIQGVTGATSPTLK